MIQIDVVPLCIVPAKVIGVMRMLDNGEADDKLSPETVKTMLTLSKSDKRPTHYPT